ncbi:MAG: T9SS type A sorting domain-containing protein, partial [Bacteroidota bacterium]
PVLAPLLRTRRARARLRTVQFRGRAHATMVYDHKPINDVFAVMDSKIGLHLSGIADLSGPESLSFGFSRHDVSITSISAGFGSLSVAQNKISGTFTTRGITIPVSITVAEGALGAGAFSGGISVPWAYISAQQGLIPDFVTLRASGTANLGQVFNKVLEKVPGGGLLKNNPFIRQLSQSLESISSKLNINAGGTVRMDVQFAKGNNPFAIRLATSFDRAVSYGTSGLLGGRRASGSGGAIKVFGPQWQGTIWHVEALTGEQFNNATRKLFYPSYDETHPLYDATKGPLSETILDEDILVKGFGKDGQPISIYAEGEYAVSFTPVNQVISGGEKKLALTTHDSRDFGNNYFNTGLAGIGIAPYDVANGSLDFGGDPIVSDLIAGTDTPNFNSQPITVASAAQIPLLDSYDGVDFTNLKVIGLDVDQATKAVNFILRGDRQNAAAPTNINNESNLLKTVFIEALSIPNNAQFVSLETNPPEAVAYEPFKHTQMGQIFFTADEQMKKDFAREVYVNPGGKNITQEWYDRLANVSSSSNFLRTILDRGVIPAISFNIRANIVPVIPKGNKEESKVFINDAKYGIIVSDAFATLRLTAANGGSVTISNTLPNGTVGITTSEFNILSTQLNQFNTFVTNRALGERNTIVNRVNNGIGAYKNLKRILPAIVAAHWYKQSNLADGSLKDIIDTGSLSSQYTGTSLSKPFNQSLWDSKANQLIASLSATSSGYTITSTITGGVTIDNKVAPGNLTTNFTNTQQVVFDQSLSDGYTSSNYLNAGGIGYNLAEIIPTGIYTRPNAKNLVAFGSEYIENRPIKIAVGVANNGNKRANNVLVNVYIQKEGGTAKRIKSTTLSSINPYETKSVVFNYNPGRIATNKLKENYKIFYRVNENEATKELSYTNNELSRVIQVAYIINSEVSSEATLALSLESSPEHLFVSRDGLQLQESTIKKGAKLSAHALNRITMTPGFKALDGSTFRAWIGTDAQGLAEYNRLTPVGSTSKLNVQKIDQTPVSKPKKHVPTLDSKLQKIRRLNQGIDKFSDPVFENYTIVDNQEIEDLVNTSNKLMNVYPNPTTGMLNLMLELPKEDQIKMEVYSLNGGIVKTFRELIDVPKGMTNLTLDLEEIANGMYMLVLRNKEGKKIGSKLILKNQ